MFPFEMVAGCILGALLIVAVVERRVRRARKEIEPAFTCPPLSEEDRAFLKAAFTTCDMRVPDWLQETRSVAIGRDAYATSSLPQPNTDSAPVRWMGESALALDGHVERTITIGIADYEPCNSCMGAGRRFGPGHTLQVRSCTACLGQGMIKKNRVREVPADTPPEDYERLLYEHHPSA